MQPSLKSTYVYAIDVECFIDFFEDGVVVVVQRIFGFSSSHQCGKPSHFLLRTLSFSLL